LRLPNLTSIFALSKKIESKLLDYMANHKSALKNIRSDKAKYLRNRYQTKSTRTFIKKLKETSDKKEAEELFQKVSGMIDKLAKKNIIHKNKAAHNKSKLARYVNSL
jgi:small subunit ribosomal protein S20